MQRLAVSWIFLVGYLALQLGLTLWVSRSIASENDFFVGGRTLKTGFVAFSMFASWFGAETCLGASGAIYESGLAGGRADPFGYSLCLLFMGLFLAVPLWRGGYMTLGDLFRARYGVAIERLVVFVLVPSSLIWAAAEVRAFGQVLGGVMGLKVTLAIYISAIFVVAYTSFGGMLGDVYTDVIQGTILASGLFILLVLGVSDLGGPVQALAQVEPQRWNLLHHDETAWQQLDRFSVPILGSLVAQELIARVAACNAATTARRASFWACGIYLIVGSSPVVLGLLGPTLAPHLQDPEQLLPTLASRLLPRFGYALFACALNSAILSTINSILLAAAALISHNLIVPAFKLQGERAKVVCARLMVVASGGFALIVALGADGIYGLVEMASGFGTAGVLVTTLAGLFLPFGGPKAAAAGLLVGAVSTPLAEYGFDLPAPFLTAIGFAAAAYVIVALVERAPARVVAAEG